MNSNFNQITFEFCCKDVIQEYHGLLLVKKWNYKLLLTLSIALHGVLKNSEKMDYSFKFNPILKIVFRYIICIPSQLFLLVIRSHIMTQQECFPFVIFYYTCDFCKYDFCNKSWENNEAPVVQIWPPITESICICLFYER